jgi:hypothetical protein
LVSGNTRRSAAGQVAARARWGPRRHVDLRKLDADTARLIRALLDNAAASQPRELQEEKAA